MDQFARFEFDLLDVLSDRLLQALSSAWPMPASGFFFKDDFSKPNEKLAQWPTRDLGLALRTVFFFFFTEIK
jgi:hypothetical protein